jgi:hypothetical protein
MRTPAKLAVAALLFVTLTFWAQNRPEANPKATIGCAPNHSELRDELSETSKYIDGLQSRIVMLRNAAGTVQNSQLRNGLQLDAEMWQAEVDHLKRHMTRMQTLVDRCEADEKINSK